MSWQDELEKLKIENKTILLLWVFSKLDEYEAKITELKNLKIELMHKVGDFEAHYLEYERENIELKEQIEDSNGWSERIIEVEEQNQHLTQINIEIKEKIEAMKCCDNCKHFYVAIYDLKCQIAGCKNYSIAGCKNYSKWELRESE